MMNSFLIASILLFTSIVNAADSKGQARLFIGSTKIEPTDVNTELTLLGIKNMDMINQYGIEITFPIINYLDAGLRYTKRNMKQDELNSSSVTNYEAEIDQDSMAAVARVPFYKSDIVRVDVFASVGGANTVMKLASATQTGELEKKSSFLATPYYSFGGSIAIGYKQFYMVIEGGLETNKVDSMSRTGNLNTNVNEIDLSGSYLTVGLMFDGIPIKK